MIVWTDETVGYAPTKATVPASVSMQLSESFASPTGVSPETCFFDGRGSLKRRSFILIRLLFRVFQGKRAYFFYFFYFSGSKRNP